VHRRRFLTATGSALLLAACTPARRDAAPEMDGDGPEVAAPTEPAPARPGPPAAEVPAPAGPGAEPEGLGRGAPEPDQPDPDQPDPDQPDPDQPDPDQPDREQPDPDQPDPEEPLPEPTEWGMRVSGVRTRLATDEPVVALTFDACGGPGGSGYDAALIEGLLDAGVPATLFVNARWARSNPDRLRRLAAEPRFELANHGTQHRPLSVTGRGAYGIAGTASREEVLAEVAGCQELLTEVTGRSPRHFRSGTAHYDEVAVRLVQDQGLEVVNFDVLGDAGATYTAAEVTAALLTATAGSIVLLHMNQPDSGTARGVLDAIPRLRDRGFAFTTLGDRALA
jgi:peptidoglycan/xylan/chitin deacetylase (PgdA/CDA1 family)